MRALVFAMIGAGLTACSNVEEDYFIPAGHPGDPLARAAAPIAIPTLEATHQAAHPELGGHSQPSAGQTATQRKKHSH